MKKQISPKLVSLIFAILVICFALGFYIFAWTEPSGDPPLNNVSAPLNVSDIDQTKIGALTFSEFRDANDDTYYINPSGVVSAVFSGRVGIGTTSPSEELHVLGAAHIQGLFESSTSAGGIALRADTGQQYEIQSVPSDDGTIPGGLIIYDRTDTAYRMVIDTVGNIGIGTASPNTKLQVAGGDVYISTPDNGLILKSPDGLTCKKVSIDNAGNLITTTIVCP